MRRPPLVLNVNDHVANLYMVSKMLRNAGFAVLEARTGQEALAAALAAEPKPELVVLDVRLPDMSGFEVCRYLKADSRTKDIKVLHTSATFVSTTSKVEGLESGADGYLTQPFEPQDLVATVRALIRLRDVEIDLQERNTALVAADRRKDEFLAMLAHELRNPLAAVQMGLPILSRFPPRDELETQTLEIVRRQTGLLVRLVDDLLDVSRVTRGRIELSLAPLDLAELVTRACDGMRARAMAPRDQELVVTVPAGPVPVRGDGNRLDQVLTNLLDNASKYSDPGTRIEVALEVAGARAVLVVRDAGIGIDPAALEAVFELFAQAPTSLARSRGGLGIGLTLVKALVELHGGAITAASEGAGRGTTFRIELPLGVEVEAEANAPAPTQAAAGEPPPCKVLVIDDNDDGREMLRALCELGGHEVIEAADGPEGVERALEGAPDIAFVDIGLPTIDGYEVARRLRARAARPIRLVALSGYGSPEHRERAFEAGFDDHIAKPISHEQLRRCIAQAARPAQDQVS
ncbi:MAG TPA: response regulator [Kofleriaceae bacterium]|nr:response regulator [Kofleriaceae bacterium]